MNEKWAKIKNYPNYKVSNYGKVKNLKNKVLKLREDRNGYLIAYLYNDGIMKCKKVHRLVAEAFIPNPKGKTQINHKDGNKKNNKVINLEWCTNKENIAHAWATGLKRKKYGRYHNNAKKIYQYDLNGNFIKEWFSIVEASTFYKTTISNIWHNLNKYNKTAKGYIWKYKKD